MEIHTGIVLVTSDTAALAISFLWDDCIILIVSLVPINALSITITRILEDTRSVFYLYYKLLFSIYKAPDLLG